MHSAANSIAAFDDFRQVQRATQPAIVCTLCLTLPCMAEITSVLRRPDLVSEPRLRRVSSNSWGAAAIHDTTPSHTRSTSSPLTMATSSLCLRRETLVLYPFPTSASWRRSHRVLLKHGANFRQRRRRPPSPVLPARRAPSRHRSSPAPKASCP